VIAYPNRHFPPAADVLQLATCVVSTLVELNTAVASG
jgi:hypothetical protein